MKKFFVNLIKDIFLQGLDEFPKKKFDIAFWVLYLIISLFLCFILVVYIFGSNLALEFKIFLIIYFGVSSLLFGYMVNKWNLFTFSCALHVLFAIPYYLYSKYIKDKFKS